MPKVGDQVIIESTKIGESRREGILIGTVGLLINVRWSDGSVSLFKPGAGSVTFVTGNGTARAAKPRKRTRKATPKAKARAASKKPAAKKPAAKKKAPAKKKSAKRR